MSNEDAIKEAVVGALRSVIDPNTNRDVLSSGYVGSAAVEGGTVRLSYELPQQSANDQTREELRVATVEAVGAIEGVSNVEVEFSVVQRRETSNLPGVKHVIAVGAGKGGVGKSTVSLILAVGLARRGMKTGLLDADVYGPSLPKLTGTEDKQPLADEQGRVYPPEFGAGIKIMSMGHIVPRDQAVVWRGPMAQKYVQEFLDRGAWGELDYLIVDLPPGTGDIPLTLAQAIPLTGAVVVCTPQDLALLDAVKALRMYQKLDVEPLGLVENMSHYVCPECGHEAHIFGQEGVRKASAELGVPLLGGIPLNISIREYGDAGKTSAYFDETDAAVAKALDEIVANLVTQVEQKSKRRTPLPQLKIT